MGTKKFTLKNQCFTEHNDQVALFQWARIMSRQHPELSMMFAIPNGGLRNIITATRLKAEGVKAGVPDIFLPVARGERHGLFLEMKRYGGFLTDRQKEWIKNLKEQGYEACVCYGWEQAKTVLENYIKGGV